MSSSMSLKDVIKLLLHLKGQEMWTKCNSFNNPDMLAAVRLLGESWIALSMKDTLLLCSWQSIWKMAKGYTSQKQQSMKELQQSHLGLQSQNILHLTGLTGLHVPYFMLICLASTHGTGPRRYGAAASVETKFHMNRASLKPKQLVGYTQSAPDKGNATISDCCCMKCVVLPPLMT